MMATVGMEASASLALGPCKSPPIMINWLLGTDRQLESWYKGKENKVRFRNQPPLILLTMDAAVPVSVARATIAGLLVQAILYGEQASLCEQHVQD